MKYIDWLIDVCVCVICAYAYVCVLICTTVSKQRSEDKYRILVVFFHQEIWALNSECEVCTVDVYNLSSHWLYFLFLFLIVIISL